MHRELLDFPENCNGSERRGIASLVTLTRYWEIRFDTEIQSELKKKTFYLDRKIITVKRHLITHKKQGTVADRWHRDPRDSGAGHDRSWARCLKRHMPRRRAASSRDVSRPNSPEQFSDMDRRTCSVRMHRVPWFCDVVGDASADALRDALATASERNDAKIGTQGGTAIVANDIDEMLLFLHFRIAIQLTGCISVFMYLNPFSRAYSGVTIIWVERFKSVFQQCLGALTRVRDRSFDTNSHSRACSRAFNQRCIRFINCTLSFTPERTGTHMSVWAFGEIFDFARRCRFCVAQLPICNKNDEWCSFFPSCANWFLSISMAGNVSIFLLLQLTYYFSIFSCRVCSRNSYIIRTTFSHSF